MSQYTKTSKYNIYIHGLVKRTHQLIFKKELKKFPSRNNAGQPKSLCTRVEWKGSHWTIRKRNIREHKERQKSMAWKYFKVKTWKLFLDSLSMRVSQIKTMQVETGYTVKNYLYTVISGFFSQNKVKKICLLSRLLDMRWLQPTRCYAPRSGYLSSHIQHGLWNNC